MSRVLLAWILLAVASTGASPATEPQIGAADRDAVAAAHDRWFAGILGKYDVLSDVLAPDVTLRFPAGNQMPRAQFLSLLETKQLFYDAAEHHETDIRVYGDAGVVTGKSTLQLRLRGTASSERLAYTAVYIRAERKWTLVAWQSTVAQR